MQSFSLLFSFLSLFSLALAQVQYVIDVFYYVDEYYSEASVIDANPTATTLALSTSPLPASELEYYVTRYGSSYLQPSEAVTVTQGDDFFQAHLEYSSGRYAVTSDISCAIDPTAGADCRETVVDVSRSSTATYISALSIDADEMSAYSNPVTVVSGVEKLLALETTAFPTGVPTESSSNILSNFPTTSRASPPSPNADSSTIERDAPTDIPAAPTPTDNAAPANIVGGMSVVGAAALAAAALVL